VADLLRQGAAWLDGQRHTHLTQTVRYQREAYSVELAATIGRTEFEQADEYGVLHRIEARDYIIRAADLLLGGETVLPKAGDQICETEQAAVHVYEVMASGSEPPWRYSDPYRVALRIHTKHVKTEAA